MNMQEIIEIAERHASRSEEDIKLSRTRDEHIRVTARANEARELVTILRGLFNNDTV